MLCVGRVEDHMAAFDLAQMNVARLRAPLDSPQLADFVGALDRINALADGSPGFIGRLQDDSGNATALSPMGEDIIVNLSVWQDAESLQAFVSHSDTVGVMRRRRDWLEPMDPSLVLWWVPQRPRPTAVEGVQRRNLPRYRGPTAAAFTPGKMFLQATLAATIDASPP